MLPELRGEPRGTCKKNKVSEHLGIGCRHWSVRPLRPLVLVGAAEGGAKSRRRSAWCPALRLLAPARRRRVYRGGVRRVLRRPRRVGHSGRGLEDVPHLVASALLPDSPQQDGSSPRYAQLNIHERLSAQSAGGQADLAPPRLQVWPRAYGLRRAWSGRPEGRGSRRAERLPATSEPPGLVSLAAPPAERQSPVDTDEERQSPLSRPPETPPRSPLRPRPLEEVDAPRALRRTVRSGR